MFTCIITEASVSVHLIYLVDLSIYQYHFMCSGLPLLIRD